MRFKQLSPIIKIIAFAFLGCIHPTKAAEVEVSLDGQKKTIWTYPHKPYFSLGTLEELKEHYQLVKPFLPPMPFRMQGKWVIPGANDTFRTFPDDLNLIEAFSANGDYVALVELERMAETATGKHLKLLTTDGKLLWEMDGGPSEALVTNTGQVVGRMWFNAPLSLSFYDVDGNIIKTLPKVFQPETSPNQGFLTQISQEKLFLVRELKELVAITYSGEVLWRYSPPSEDGDRTVLIGESGLDPLGRGIYVPLSYGNGTTSIVILNPQTGEAVGAVWNKQPLSIPRYFSPSGRYAGTVRWDGIDLVDWKTGQVLFTKTPTERDPDIIADYGDASSISDNPPRFALSAIRVFDETGKQIWSLKIENIGYYKAKISANGDNVAAVVMNPQTLELKGLILYKITDKS